MEGGGVNEIHDKPLQKFRGREDGSGFARYVMEKYQIATSSSPKFQYILVYSFEIASKYVIVITVVSTSTFFQLK